jgi:hypothetical protein
VLEGEVRPRDPDYRAALMGLTTAVLPEATAGLVRIYRSSKDQAYRLKVLTLLFDHPDPELEGFFAEAYARERYLDMKVAALRGLAQFATEEEIDTRLAGFRKVLAKREMTTPLNFSEYEYLRQRSALPYLVERYGYPSLHRTLQQVQEQYDRMPDEVKGLIGEDENGRIVPLVTRAEHERRLKAALAIVAAL